MAGWDTAAQAATREIWATLPPVRDGAVRERRAQHHRRQDERLRRHDPDAS